MDGARQQALVTASTGGIGKEIAFRLAAQGMAVVLCGRSREKGQATLAALQRLHPHPAHRLWLGDLLDMDAVRRLAVAARGITVLVNNVGGMFQKTSQPARAISQTFALNLLSPWLLTHLLLPGRRQQPCARVVNVGSLLHHHGHAGTAGLAHAQGHEGRQAYATAKLALLAHTFHLAAELQGSSVHVIATDPGIADTPGFNATHAGLAGAMTRTWLSLSPDFHTARKAALSTAHAATHPDGVYCHGKLIGVDGKPLRPAPKALHIPYGREVDAYCKALAQAE